MSSSTKQPCAAVAACDVGVPAIDRYILPNFPLAEEANFVEQDLRLATVVSLPFEQNSFVASLAGRDDCLVIDPGLEPEKILQILRDRQLTPAAILVTHGHSDHIGGNAALKQHWPQCPLVIGVGDAAKLSDPWLNLSAAFGERLVSPAADITLDDGDRYAAAGFELEVLEIPGHSAGHVAYVWRGQTPPIVWVGDIIFAGGIGRTDFPDGDTQQLLSGIRSKLFTLPDETILLPGHGPATTVGEEKRYNPFVGSGAR
jgi:hydroxyacylglutathione hydrolase